MRIANTEITEAIDSADFFIFGLGYEPRCTFIAEMAGSKIKGKSLAIGYSYSQVFGYKDSASTFKSLGACVIDGITDEAFQVQIRDVLKGQTTARTILVDISSLNRARMAALVDLLLGELAHKALSVYFVYASGKFVEPATEVVQNQSIGPIGVAFSGMLATPELPPEIVVGLGYETGKALGAVEYLQCSDLWLFVPCSDEERFEAEVRRVNHLLLEQVGSARTFRYRVEDPAGTYADLRSLMHGMVSRANPMLLPLGPKLFALICLLVAMTDKNVSVWRASQGLYEVQIPREASGHATALLVCNS